MEHAWYLDTNVGLCFVLFCFFVHRIGVKEQVNDRSSESAAVRPPMGGEAAACGVGCATIDTQPPARCYHRLAPLLFNVTIDTGCSRPTSLVTPSPTLELATASQEVGGSARR